MTSVRSRVVEFRRGETTMLGRRARAPRQAPAEQVQQEGRIALELPFASPIARKLARIYVYVLFLAPGTLLDRIGYDYSAIGGSQITKIHISTYLLFLLSAVFLVTYPKKRDLFAYYVAKRLGSLFFFAVSTVALINIVVGKRNGFGMYIDTDLHLFLISMLLPFVTPGDMDRLEKFLHVFFLVNALVAIVELASGWHPFPLVTYSPDGYTFNEPRATAFLAHPLHAATITCVYIISLLCGGGSFSKAWMRPAMVGLQCMALLAFGGRTAFALTMGVLGLMLLWQCVLFLAGAKQQYERILAAALVPPIAVIGIAALLSTGVLDQFIERFVEDGGSARTRLLMWPLLTSFKTGDMLWGAPTEYVFSQVVSHGLEWGVENPFIQMAVYQGVVIATMIMVGIVLTLYDNYKRLEPKSFFAMATFMLLCNSFGSFAGRFYTIAIFIVQVTIMFRRRGVQHVV